jgi:hypothetical protein
VRLLVSEGPIKREREGTRSAFSSTPDNVRVCMRNPDTKRAYCGRKINKGLVQSWSLTVCTDCRAAARADGRLQ